MTLDKKECCEKCSWNVGLNKKWCTDCPCHQSSDNSVESWEIKFEKEFGELKKRRDPTIINALLQPKVVLTTGAENYLAL